jgi:hypothetical protein
MNASLLLFDPDRISPFIARFIELSLFMCQVHGFLELFRKCKDFIHASADLLGRSLIPVFTYTLSATGLIALGRWAGFTLLISQAVKKYECVLL